MCVSAEQGPRVPDILGDGFVLHTVVHHGVRLHPDIFRGQGEGAAGHTEAAVQAEKGRGQGGGQGGEGVFGRGAQPVGRVADDELHHARATAPGRDRHVGWRGGGARGRLPFAAGHADEHHAAGDRVRLRERREHQRREQGRRQGHAQGVHHAGQPPADGQRRPGPRRPVPGVQRGRGRGHGQRAGAVVVRLGQRAEVRRRQAGQGAAVQAHIRRRPQVGQGGRVGQGQAGHTGHRQGVHDEPGRGGARAVPRGGGRRVGRGRVPVQAQAAGPGAREAADRAQKGETGHAHIGPHHGLVHRVLAAVLLHVHTVATVPRVLHTAAGVHHSLLAGLHELGHQPGHLHDLQQGLSAQLPACSVQMIKGARHRHHGRHRSSPFAADNAAATGLASRTNNETTTTFRSHRRLS